MRQDGTCFCSLSQLPHFPEKLLSAGILPILVASLAMQVNAAEGFLPLAGLQRASENSQLNISPSLWLLWLLRKKSVCGFFFLRGYHIPSRAKALSLYLNKGS